MEGREREEERRGNLALEESTQAQEVCDKRVLGKKMALCQQGQKPTHGPGHAGTLSFEFLVLAKL